MAANYPTLIYPHELPQVPVGPLSATDVLFLERNNGDGTYTSYSVTLSGLSAQGVVGPQGPQGFQGFQGFQGAQGFQGSQGYQGVQGELGPGVSNGVSGYIPLYTGSNTLSTSNILINSNGTVATIVGTLSATGNVVYGTSETNRIYVSKNGSDNNIGTNPSQPFLTIKKAAAYAAAHLGTKYTIMVATGDYSEVNPIYLAPNVSLIGDNLRRTTIRAINRQLDILWCTNSVYVWGFTFRDHLEPAAATAFPVISAGAAYNAAYSTVGYEITAPAIKPYIVTSPYIQGCSSITTGASGLSAGCGMRVDGSLVTGYLRSFVTDSYTQFNQGGKGIHIINNGYAQLVSTFTICSTEGVMAESGGTCSINTSNCSFGLSGIVAKGYSSTPILTGFLVTNAAINSDTFSVSGITPRTYPTYDLPVDRPYLGLVFKVVGDTSDALYSIDSVTQVDPITYRYTIVSSEKTVEALSAGSLVNFYIRSTITTSSHTMEYVGSGVEIATAIPAAGGIGNPDNEAVGTAGGAVYFTSTNQLGNFKVGTGFTIVQSTGTIQGEVFNKSILSLVTPLTLALE